MSGSTASRLRISEPADIIRRLAAAWQRLLTLIREPEYQLLLAITLLAAFLRLAYLDLIPFGPRQAAQLESAAPLAEEFQLPLTGARSDLGVPDPPWASYLYALPLLLGRDARVASAFACLLHVASLLACYASVRRFYGRRAAALTAVLLAVNPWAIVHARGLSAGSLLLPFGVLLLHGLNAAIVARRPWGWSISVVGLAMMLAVSHAAWFLVPGLALLLIVYRRRVRWSHLLLGLCVALLILSPYLYYLNETRAADLRAVAAQLRESAGFRSPLQVLTLASELHSGLHLSALAGAASEAYAPGFALLGLLDRLAQAWFLLALLALVAFAALSWGRWQRAEDPALYLLLIVWLWAPLVLLAGLGGNWVSQQTLLILYPAGFVAMAAALDKLLELPEGYFGQRRWWAPLAKAPVWLFLLAVLAWQAYATLYLGVFVQRHDTSAGYGTPYRFFRRAAALVTRETYAADTDQLWVVAAGDAAQPELQPAIDFLIGPRLSALPLGNADAPALLLPAEQSGVYLVADARPEVSAALRSVGSASQGLVTHPETNLTASVEVAEPLPLTELLSRIQHPGLWTLRGGPLLLGYDWPRDARAGATVSVATYWSFAGVTERQRNLAHEIVLQIVGPETSASTTVDPFGLPASEWREGQILVVWSDLQLPASAGECALTVGLRAQDGTYNVLLDAQGEVGGYLVPVGEVRVQP